MKIFQATLALLVVFMGALVDNYVDGCSCLPVHPQEEYCRSDFVIVARIRKEFLTDQHRIYKARIRKEFKMTEKAKLALKSGKILTGLDGAMCGVHLEIGKVYLLLGRVMGLQAHINLCGYTKPWKTVTARQKKGFRLLYNRGCNCKISRTYRVPIPKDRCSWNNDECHRNFGICLRSPSGQCHWSKSVDLQRCLKGELVDPFRKRIIAKPHFEPMHENRLHKVQYEYEVRPRRDHVDKTS